jgi:hypothetical protein
MSNIAKLSAVKQALLPSESRCGADRSKEFAPLTQNVRRRSPCTNCFLRAIFFLQGAPYVSVCEHFSITGMFR